MKSHASMNRIYRLVFNAVLGIWVAVAENAKGRGKGGRAACALIAVLAIISPSAYAANAADASVVVGTGSVSTSGLTTTINQTSQRLAIDWTQLSTAANEALRFNQPNAQAIALNRITGSSPSSFLGSLTANGQVFILNPNGVLFGAGSQVNVGGLVASTLAMSNADFQAGRNVFTNSGGRGSVVNQGTMTAAQGGYLALLAPEVRNEGVMTASLGTALLAAGNKVTLNLDNGSLLGYSIDQGAINALAENKQLIKADGGQVLLSARALDALTTATVNNTGVIEARTIQNKAGRIMLMGDMEHGTVNVGGTLDASAPTDGNGGFIETSAAHVNVAVGTKVTTLAANGKTGKWLIDPNDFTIAASGGNMDAATVVSNLASTDFEIQTATMGTAGNGDIHVDEALTWTSANTLTLTAQRNININQTITATNGGLTLNAANQITAPAAVSVGTFTLANGTWSQLGTLPAFSARDFRINSGTFIRALGGDGLSAGSAYQIADIYGLQGAGSAGMLDKNYQLANNIDASGTVNWNNGAGFNPIGDSRPGHHFTGNLAGLGRTINNLTIYRPDTDYVGLFGFLGDPLSGVYQPGASSNAGNISNVGLVGGSVTGRAYVGSLVGSAFYGMITNSYASTTVAGISGSAYADSVGGLVGAAEGMQIRYSYATGNVTGGIRVGGLVGDFFNGRLMDSYASGEVRGVAMVGGLAGRYGSAGTGDPAAFGLIRSHATGDVIGDSSGSAYVGGLVGSTEIANFDLLTGLYATGQVSGGTYVGGLIGLHSGGQFNNGYATGKVTATGDFVGGLIGLFEELGPSELGYVTASGNVRGANQVGGLIGGVGSSSYSRVGNIYEAYASGNVSGVSHVGGLVGELNSGAVSNAYSTGDVSGTDGVGGLVGYNQKNISLSYASGAVTGTSNVGGLVGINPGAGSVTSSYWDTTTTGQSGSAGGVGLANSAAYSQASYSGLDLANVWYLKEGYTRPILRSEYTTVIRNAHQLQLVNLSASTLQSSYGYRLANDIDMSGLTRASDVWNTATGFVPLGDATTAFTGSFDGQNHTISNLFINRPTEDNVGLFGVTGGSANIRNLGLVDGSVTGNSNVGALVGRNQGSVSNSYATADVTGGSNVGALVGENSGSVSNAYSTGNVTGNTSVGGLVGENSGTGTVSNSYSNGKVNDGVASSDVGGLVGTNSGGAVSNSFWDMETSGQTTSDGGTGITTIQMQQANTFTGAGWSASNVGGDGKTWRIYDGQTGPLLRSFLTPLNLTPVFDGTASNPSNIGAYTVQGTPDATKLLGPVASASDTLTLSNTGTANEYIATVAANRYSHQQGYDLITHRAIATPGSAAGDVKLGNNISFTDGALVMSATGNIDLNHKAITGSGSNSYLLINGGTAINAGAVTVDTFLMFDGTWQQSVSTLPAFVARDFSIFGGTFIRAKGGDGSTATPYQIADVYGLQGAGSSGMLSQNYKLANNIDASGTAHWNNLAGFNPIGDGTTAFSGTFDGNNKTITGLNIDRAATDGVGLFGVTDTSASISNVGLVGASITGDVNVGALVGINNGGSISNAYSTTGIIISNNGYAGGLVGGNFSGNISNSYSTGSVNGNIGSYTGGLVGVNNSGSISNAYSTSSVNGTDNTGGLVGGNFNGTVSNAYSTGSVNGTNNTGGLMGLNFGGSISNTYSTGNVNNGIASSNVGGLVGQNSSGSVTDSFWNTDTSGQATSASGTGISDGYMKEASTFTNWSIASTGGSTAVWRIYAGYTSPLLRSFLTPLLVQPTYDGSGAALNIAGSLALPAGTDMSKISGNVIDGTTLTLTSNGLAGSYTASASTWGLYSGQQGYDMSSAVRTISTPGSAVGDIKLGNNISFTDGTLAMSATGNIDLNGKAITGSGSNSFLQINAGTAINAGAVSVDSFVMMDGTWSQVASTLPAFAARDFSLWGGTFIRAKGGDGSTLTPYQIADVYGLQGVDSLNMAGKHYLLANNIDASGTAAWNSGFGFTPIGTVAGSFTGTFDGMGHTISGLTIDRPGTDRVGLFRATGGSAAIRNVGLVGGSVKGANEVGVLVGYNQASITGSYASTDVTGYLYVGGLVGLSINGSISDSHADGVVNGAGSVGGLVGYSVLSAISHSYATGNVIGRDYVGGLIGRNGYYNTTGSISDSYATGNVTGRHRLGGLVGGHLSDTITNSYATGSVNGSGSGIGGLVGELSYATVSNSYYSTGSVTGISDTGGLVGTNDSGVVTNSFWDKQTSGQTSSAGSASSAGKTTAEMRMASTYTDAGWSASNVGGDGSTWRIYEGQSGPLLRSYLTAYNLTPTFDGGASSPSNIGAYTVPGGVDPKLLGTAVSNDTLTLASTGTANTYSATSSASGHYSHQQGYDITATRTITTSGNAAGDIKLDNNISFTDGALVLSATGNINLNGKAITGSNGFMLINGGTAINAGAVSIDAFVMVDGTWSQSAPTLPTFAARDFTIAGGTFIRAKGGDGSTATPYQIADIYGLQGAGSSGMLGNHYKLANNIDASGTSSWNNLAGFNPIGEGNLAFSGTFDGNNKTITGLSIDRAAADNIGLFGATSTSASISNVGLVGGSVAGNSNVGALIGSNQGSVSNSYATSPVTGAGDATGGLLGFNSGTINNSHATGVVNGDNIVGGLVGHNYGGGVITNSYATTGQVTATGYHAGGLIGYNAYGGSAVTNSYATGNVTGLESVGGLIGYTEFSTITNSYATGRVIATRRTAGGLVGTIYAYGTDVVSNSYSTGDVSGPAGVGGLVGENDGGIRNSYSTGNVSGNDRVGGLVGFNVYGSVSDSYSISRVNGVGATGGLVGYNGNGSITNSYSTGNVNNGIASIYVGGLVGRNYSGSVSDSFWDVTKSGQATSDGGTGKTTAQLMQAATFTNWDMASAGGSTAVWRIYEGNTGPLLRSFLTARTLADTTLTYNGSTQTATAAGALITDASGRNAGTYGSYSTQQGYDLSGGDLIISKASLTLAAVTDSKTYNGSAASTATVVKTGLASGDSVTLLTQSFGSKNALGTGGSTLAVDAGYVVADGNSGGNYNVTLATASGSINKATLSVSGAVAGNKTYNGSDAATLSSIGTLSGLVTGEALTLSQTAATFADKNAGIGKTVTATGYGIADGTGGLASNYQLASTSTTANANIDKATLTLAAATDSKTYDGSATSAAAVLKTGLASGDSVTSLSQSFGSKNVLGAGLSTLSVDVGYTLNDGNGGGNYNVTTTTAAGSIGKANLTLAAATDTKTYDGNATSAAAVSKNGLATGDSVTSLSQSFGSRNVLGAGLSTISVDAGYTVNDGNSGGNYNVTTATALGSINKADLTLAATTDSKTYDSTATSNAVVVKAGLVGGDSVTGLSQSFGSKNVLGNNGSTLSVDTGYTVADGNSGGNYNVIRTTANGTINKANLTLTAVTDGKTYDGTRSSSASVTASGLIGGDSVTAAQSFNSKNVMGAGGSTLSVSAGYTVADGNSGGNYTVTTNAAAGTINKAVLNITATPNDKVYDGNTMATASYADNRIAGDVLTYSASASFADKNVANGIVVTVGGVTTSGADAGNYTVGSTTVVGNTADITPKTLTVTANDATHPGGTPYSGGNGVVYSGFVAGEGTSALTGAVAYSGDSQGASKGGLYDITPGGLNARNYSLEFVEGTLTIQAVPEITTNGVPSVLSNAYKSILSIVSNQGGTGTGDGGGANSAANKLNAAAEE